MTILQNLILIIKFNIIYNIAFNHYYY